MNKEEILERSRQENQESDERELQIRLKAGQIAKGCGVAIAVLLALMEDIWLGSGFMIGGTAFTIAFGMMAIESWIIACSVKKSTAWVKVLFDTAFFIAELILLLKGLL